MLLYKLGWTLLGIFVYCFGSEIVLPFVDSSLLQSNDIFLNNMLRQLAEFSGGRYDNASLFALGIGPYISASIFMSAMFKCSDYLMNKKKYEDPNIITRYTKLATLPIAIWQSIFFINNLFKAVYNEPKILVGVNINSPYAKIGHGLLLMLVLVSSTMFLTWLSDFITDKGIGQGSSVMIATGIFHHALKDLRAFAAQNNFRVAAVVFIAMLSLICLIETSYRRLPLTYYKGRESRGRKYNIHTTLPLKFNSAGILPVIFASQLSINAVRFFQFLRNRISLIDKILLKIPHGVETGLSQTGPLVLSTLLLIFCYLYLDIFGSPDDLAKHLQSRSGVIDGKRPGAQTKKLLTKKSGHLALFGGLYLAITYHFTRMAAALFKVSFIGIFNSSSAMICVLIVIEVIAQLSSSLSSTLYMRRRTLGKQIL